MSKEIEKKKRKRGNAAVIAATTKFSLVYVRQVLAGDRQNEIIVETAGIVEEEKAAMLNRVKERVKKVKKSLTTKA